MKLMKLIKKMKLMKNEKEMFITYLDNICADKIDISDDICVDLKRISEMSADLRGADKIGISDEIRADLKRIYDSGDFKLT